MVHKIVFTVAIYATSILAQDQHPAKQISSSGDRMSSIFQWADFVKPRTDRFDTRTGDTVHRLTSDSAIESRPPDLEIGFPSASDVVRPKKRTYPAEASSARKPSVVSGQVLQSQVDKQQRQSSPTGKELQTQVVRQIKQPSQTGKVLLSQIEKPKQPFTSSKIITSADKQPKQSSASRTEPLPKVYKHPKQPFKSSSSFLKMPTDLPSGDIAPERRGTIDRAPATGIGQEIKATHFTPPIDVFTKRRRMKILYDKRKQSWSRDLPRPAAQQTDLVLDAHQALRQLKSIIGEGPTDLNWDHDCDDISIIGAGIGGSYAGYRLRDLGKKITIYEYSDRIGGRCYTGKLTGVPDVNVEYGAMRFKPKEHKLLTQVIKELGLKIVHFDPQFGPFSDSNLYHRGRHMRYGDIPYTNLPYYLPEKFKGKTPHEINWELFRDNTNVNPNVDGYMNDRRSLKSADGVDLWKQSRQEFTMKYVPADTAKFIQDVTPFDYTYRNVTAAVSIPTSPLPLKSKPMKTVATGFQSIPETMITKFLDASVRHSFLRNHQLLTLKKNETNGKYLLTFQPTETEDGITRPVREGHYLPWEPRYACASKVILAVTKLALEHIDWEGLKQPEIQDYITNSVSSIPGAKLYLAFDKAWWRDHRLEDPDKPHYSLSDTPLRQTLEFGISKTKQMAVLNAGYTDLYLDVNFWRKMNEQGLRYPGTSNLDVATTTEVVRYAMKFLSEIYNISISRLHSPVYAALQLWDRYPYGAGWHLWRPGYNWKEVETRMLRPSPSDDVFLVCNAFLSSDSVGWAEGSLELVELVMRYFRP